MGDYFYPSGDSEAFVEEMNERLGGFCKIAEVDHDFCPKYRVEGDDPISSIFIKGQTFKEIVWEVAPRYHRAPPMFEGNEFWFFALP